MQEPSTTADLAPFDYVAAGESPIDLVFCVLAGVAFLFGALLIASLLRRLVKLVAAEKRQRMLQGGHAPLTIGRDRAVRGTVEYAGRPDGIAVDVRITQEVRNNTSGRIHSHDWVEASRNVVSAPFLLITPQGEKVHVDPGEKVLVADRLVTSHPGDVPSTSRIRQCDVKHGEVFTAYGDLDTGTPSQAAYRDGKPMWLLTPSAATGRMLLATETPTERYRARILHLALWGIPIATAWLAYHLVAIAPHLVSARYGHAAKGVVDEIHTTVTKRSKSSMTDTHYHVTARGASPDEVVVSAEVSEDTYKNIEAIKAARPDVRIPLWVGPKDFPSYLGHQASCSRARFVVPWIPLFIALMLLAFTHDKKVAWYDRNKLNESGGPGTWPPG